MQFLKKISKFFRNRLSRFGRITPGGVFAIILLILAFIVITFIGPRIAAGEYWLLAIPLSMIILAGVMWWVFGQKIII